MELPHMGQTCVICRRNDYLPFRCQHCEKIVCVDHKANHGSDCPLTQTSFTTNISRETLGESIKQSCDFCGKITLKLELSKCPHCSSDHCLYHRHQVQHDCVKISEDATAYQFSKEVKAQRQREALDRLKNLQAEREAVKSSIKGVPASESTSHKPLDPKKQALARRVRIMKIKSNARGPPNVLDQDKMFFEVKFQHEPKSSLSNESKHGKSVSIFAATKHTIGRLIDFVASDIDLTNNNHVDGADQLVFQVDSADIIRTTLDCQKSFQAYIESGVLDSGDQLFLTYKLDT